MDEFEKALSEIKDAAPKTEGTYERFSIKAKRHKEKNIHARKNLHVGRKIGIACAALASVVILLPGIGLLAVSMRIKDVHHTLSRAYSLKEAREIQEETFRRLNSFEYLEGGDDWKVEDAYRDAVNAFADSLYEAMPLKSNAVYSPLSLYLHLDLLSHGLANQTGTEAFDNALCLPKKDRDENFLSAFYGNRRNEKTFASMANGAFLDDGLTFQGDYLDYLTSKYVEAYSMDFGSETDRIRMMDWANGNLNEAMMNDEDFDFPDEISFALLSLLEFHGKWSFEKEDTYEVPFLCKDGSEVNVPMMHDTFYGTAYDYGDYWSFTMPFANGYLMQVMTPDEREGDIFSILKGKSFLQNDPEKAYVAEGGYDEYLIEVGIPRFEASSSFSFVPALEKMGLGFLYDRDNPAFDGIAQEASIFLVDTKQKNKVFWDEEGFRGKTVTFSMAAGSAAPMPNGVRFTLDSPFVYVIKDPNGLPLYLGNVSSF